jgi:hypothetical protein
MSIAGICLVILTSSLLIGLGFCGLKRDYSFISTEEQLQKDLVRWQVFGGIHPSATMLVDIKQSWCYLRAITAIGGGVGVLLMAFSITVISLATTGTVDGIDSGDSMFFMVTFYSSLFLGFGVGETFAIWRLRKATKRHVTYADLQQRRLSDYRSGLFRWLSLAILVETIAFSWFFAPHLGSTLRLLQSNGSPIDVPNSLWLLSIVPITIAVVSIMAEFLMSHIARLSRLLITTDPMISRRADDMLRATAIGTIQTSALVALASLGLLQNGLIVRSLWTSGYWQLGNRPYSEISSLFFFLLLLTLGLSIGLIVAHGRLGGRLSGWPCQAKPVEKLRDRQ